MKYGKSYCCKNEKGDDIYLFALRNNKNTEVLISNYGATITSFKIKSGNDEFTDIVLGFDKIENYLDEKYHVEYPYFGAAIGRYANRIKNAAFTIDNKDYKLTKNRGTDQLHGGFSGFDSKVWKVISFDYERQNKLHFKYESKDGEEGFPGNLEVEIHFELTENNELIYEYMAVTDEPTAINLTHHSYFNLNNGDSNILDHVLTIHSDKILEQDGNLVANGNFLPVENTAYDFRNPTPINKNINTDSGFDQTYVINPADEQVRLAATVYSPKTKLQLQVYTTEPVVHLYTGQGIPKLTGKHQIEYGPYSGLCLETHLHPNAINIPDFPNTILRPGETYRAKTIYKLTVASEK